jgi:hypothetical protein
MWDSFVKEILGPLFVWVEDEERERKDKNVIDVEATTVSEPKATEETKMFPKPKNEEDR